jgi:hypothetical protein
MECEANERRDSSDELLGVEVRVYVSGDFHYSRLYPNSAAADAEAESLRRDSMEFGWIYKPPMPDRLPLVNRRARHLAR